MYGNCTRVERSVQNQLISIGCIYCCSTGGLEISPNSSRTPQYCGRYIHTYTCTRPHLLILPRNVCRSESRSPRMKKRTCDLFNFIYGQTQRGNQCPDECGGWKCPSSTFFALKFFNVQSSHWRQVLRGETWEINQTFPRWKLDAQGRTFGGMKTGAKGARKDAVWRLRTVGAAPLWTSRCAALTQSCMCVHSGSCAATLWQLHQSSEILSELEKQKTL